MRILDKFQAVEIKADTRISNEDKIFCQTHQKAFDNARESLSELLAVWQDMIGQQADILTAVETESYTYQQYISISHFSSSDIQDKMKSLPEMFIENIIRYFNKKYKVSIDSSKVKEVLLPTKKGTSLSDQKDYGRSLCSLKPRYEDIIEQIFIQLDGRSFTEQALAELKEKCHKAAWNSYQKTASYDVKGDTIRFTHYACSYSTWIRTRWELNDSMKNVLRGLAHFETDSFNLYPIGFQDLLSWREVDYPSVDFPTCTKALQLKMFKNGRVDIKFASKALAEQFASEYLGLVC